MSSPPTPRSDTHRFGWSLLAAFGLHGGIAALLWLAPPRVAPTVERLTIELRETSPALPTAPSRPVVTRPPRTRPPTPPTTPLPPPPAADAPSEALGSPSIATTGTPDVSGDEGDDDISAPPAEPPAGRAAAAVDPLHPEALEGALAQWRSVRGPGEEGDQDEPGVVPYGHGDDSPEAEQARVERRVARGVRRTEAESRVAAGLVDPYFAQVGRGADKRLKPSQEDLGIKEGLEGYVGSLLSSWGGAGKQWAETGSPLRDPDSMLSLNPQRNAEVDGHALRGKLPDPAEYAWLWNSGQLATQLFVVEIELVQQPDGTPITARILKPSHSKRFDAMAKESLLSSAEEHGAPSTGLGLGGTRITSHWRVEAQPVPQVPSAVTDPANGGTVIGLAASGVFDEVLGEGPSLPGQVRIIHRVTLLAVYGGGRGPMDAADAGN